jgi:hypothetical protein
LVLVADDREEFQHIAGFYATGYRLELRSLYHIGTSLTVFGEKRSDGLPLDQSKQRRVKGAPVAGISSGAAVLGRNPN